MIKGHINENLELRVKIMLPPLTGKRTEIEAILDTGFNGDICLSQELVEAVKLDYLWTTDFELANGEVEKKDVFLGEVIFDGERKEALFIITKGEDTLLGANLLKTKELYINYKQRLAEINEAT